MSNYIIGIIAAIMVAILAYTLLGDLLGGRDPIPPLPTRPPVVEHQPNTGINQPQPIETQKP